MTVNVPFKAVMHNHDALSHVVNRQNEVEVDVPIHQNNLSVHGYLS